MENGTAKDGSLRFAAALDTDQVFEARIVGPPGRIDDLLKALDFENGTRLRMGAAASAGGRFEVDGEIDDVEPTVPDAEAELVAVDLLSRAVLTDPFLRAVTLPKPPEGWCLVDRGGQPWAYTALEEVHGWNAGQQLPKPVDLAVTAGSVLVLRRSESNDAASLQGWLDHGIGLRRSEGFGEISFRPAVDESGQGTGMSVSVGSAE
jgi:CRISPR-associated protein Csx10